MLNNSRRSWNCPWMSPQIVTGAFTCCTLDSLIRISFAYHTNNTVNHLLSPTRNSLSFLILILDYCPLGKNVLTPHLKTKTIIKSLVGRANNTPLCRQARQLSMDYPRLFDCDDLPFHRGHGSRSLGVACTGRDWRSACQFPRSQIYCHLRLLLGLPFLYLFVCKNYQKLIYFVLYFSLDQGY